jgi:hypothetical protein
MLGWSLAVSASMPSWYDPDRDCAQAFPLATGDGLRISTQWLPPRAACVYGDNEAHQFISPTRSTVLTIVFGLTAALTVFGLYFVIRRLVDTPGLLRSAEAVNLRARQLRHLGIGGGLTLLIVAVYTGANVFAAFLAGPPGMLIMAITAAISLAAVAAALDREHGPLPSTPRDSRRRGTVVGLGTFATVFVVTVASGNFPFYQLWVAPVGAIAYLVLTGLQWSRSSRTDREPRNGDAVEQDLLR